MRIAGLRVDGMWTVWSPWSQCRRPCTNSTWRRTRICDNPRPLGMGVRCKRGRHEQEIEAQFRNDFHLSSACENSSSNSTSVKTAYLCKCGCNLHVSTSKNLLFSPVAGECQARNIAFMTTSSKEGNSDCTLLLASQSQTENGIDKKFRPYAIVWKQPANMTFVTTEEWKLFTSGQRFLVHFSTIDFQLVDGELLTISDQLQTISVTSETRNVTSSSHVVTVTYFSSPRKALQKSCGFILSYIAVDKESIRPPISTTSVYDTKQNKENFLWTDIITENPVLFGAISACALIILIVCIVVIRYRCSKSSNTRKERNPTKCRLNLPPDGKSSSNLDTESERPQPLGGDEQCDTITSTTIKPRSAYYLAQRQLRLMKKHGPQAASQTYTTTCINNDLIHEQRDLLFGALSDEADNAL